MKITSRENVFVGEDFLSTVKKRAIENNPVFGALVEKLTNFFIVEKSKI